MDIETPLMERINTIIRNKNNSIKHKKIQIYSKEQCNNSIKKNKISCPSIKTLHRNAKRHGSQLKYSTLNVRQETKRKLNFKNLGEDR